jgi:hypothetical protein
MNSHIKNFKQCLMQNGIPEGGTVFNAAVGVMVIYQSFREAGWSHDAAVLTLATVQAAEAKSD